MGLTPKHLTPAAEQVTCMGGVVCDSFAEAADDVLTAMAGLRVSESTVQRTAEEAGHRVGRLLAAGKTLGFPQPWDWHRDARPHLRVHQHRCHGRTATGRRRRAGRGPHALCGHGL